MEKKENTVEFEVVGDRALFSDPITRVGGERTSYFVPTYEALKGILSSIYWRPTIIWIIDAVRVMNPIQTEPEGVLIKNYNGGYDRSIYTYLKEVRYQVRGHFIFNKNRPELQSDRDEKKHLSIAKRMIERGGRRDVFLGTRECHADVFTREFGEGKGAYDDINEFALGYMFHGFTYADEAELDGEKEHLSARYHNVVMKKGVIEFPEPKNIPKDDRRVLHKMSIKKFGKKLGNFIENEEFPDKKEV